MTLSFPLGLLSYLIINGKHASVARKWLAAVDAVRDSERGLDAWKARIASARREGEELGLFVKTLTQEDETQGSPVVESLYEDDARVVLAAEKVALAEKQCDQLKAQNMVSLGMLAQNAEWLTKSLATLNRIHELLLASKPFMIGVAAVIVVAVGIVPLPTFNANAWLDILTCTAIKFPISLALNVAFESLWLNYLCRLARTSPEEMVPPNIESGGILEALFTDKTRELVFQPVIEDEKLTWQNAMDAGRYLFADWIRIRAKIILLHTALCYVKTEIIDKLRWR